MTTLAPVYSGDLISFNVETMLYSARFSGNRYELIRPDVVVFLITIIPYDFDGYLVGKKAYDLFINTGIGVFWVLGLFNNEINLINAPDFVGVSNGPW